jgi:hypothetical protein
MDAIERAEPLCGKLLACFCNESFGRRGRREEDARLIRNRVFWFCETLRDICNKRWFFVPIDLLSVKGVDGTHEFCC